MDTELKTQDDELAEAYVANRELSLLVCEEFSSVDRDAWSHSDCIVERDESR